jgi:hypothetical protein
MRFCGSAAFHAAPTLATWKGMAAASNSRAT